MIRAWTHAGAELQPAGAKLTGAPSALPRPSSFRNPEVLYDRNRSCNGQNRTLKLLSSNGTTSDGE